MNAIKKIKENILIVIVVISLILIVTIKFSPLSSIHTSQVPLISWFSYGSQLGETIYNLSYGYLISWFFYLMVVRIPELKSEKKALIVFDNSIDKIIGIMSITNNYFWIKHEINNLMDDASVSFEVEKRIKKFTNHEMNFYFQVVKGDSDKSLHYTGYYTESKFLMAQYHVIKETIENMYQTPIFNLLNSELIFTLSEINNCLLFRFLKKAEINDLNFEKIEESSEIGSALLEYYRLYKKLSELKVPNEEYTFDQQDVDCWWIIDLKKGKFRFLSREQ
ncbi:hypothetical protein ACFVAD_20525 [Sutcliffiella sp. NPDC057660]|uniref:hypothetical protein n=1 Tax=Sutcliffiella sp. NPDC057660 TaxID=3346199 RepID=UPI003674ED03